MDRRHHITIFTTASLPWMTGTAVNPLFRAAYLEKCGDWKVTLVIPWLSLKDQELVYPNKITFNSPLEHEAYVRRWLEESTRFTLGFSIRFYPGKIIRLSAATQDLPRSIVCNVHGVNPKFIKIGKIKEIHQVKGGHVFSKGAYYIGKMLWSKGYRELLQLLSEHQNKLPGVEVDLHGNGEDSDQVRMAAKKLKLTVRVYPGRDHADPLFHDYKVFINPSTTDVVCTTTAEALAMGKIVICADHPSNDFFKQFPNCRMYNDEDEFVNVTLKALSEEPAPLTDDQRHELSWEAATERFVRAAELNQLQQVISEKSNVPSSQPLIMSLSLKMHDLRSNIENASALLHHAVSGSEAARCALGAIPRTLQPDEQQCRELGFPVGKESSL